MFRSLIQSTTAEGPNLFDKHLKPVTQAGDCERLFASATQPFQWVPVWGSMTETGQQGTYSKGISMGVRKKVSQDPDD